MNHRGFYGLAIYDPKNVHNWGSLFRTANILGCDFIASINRRFPKQASDTLKTHRHVPIFEYKDFDDFYNHIPYNTKLIGIELTDKATDLKEFKHPERAVYLLGSEDNGLPMSILNRCHETVKLSGRFSMNVACAGSIVLYHRTNL